MRAGLSATVAVAALGLAACSSDSGDTDPPTGHESQAAAVAWSPCDGLTARAASRLVGEEVRQDQGTPEQPRCTFTPARTGGPAYDVSYLWFDGGLDEALDAMGAVGSQLEPVPIPGADAARLAVRARKDGVLVTGFVQTGGLVQSVNAVDLRPYDEDAVVDGTKALLAELAAQAPQHPTATEDESAR